MNITGHFGFSYIGLSFLLMLIIPNLIWVKLPPKGYASSGENKILLFFERVGQVLVFGTALFFSDYNSVVLQPFSLWTLWFIAATVLMVMYECWWVRYFRSKRTEFDLYSSFFGIPLAGAVLPVAAFFLLGIYGKIIWLILSVTVFGIGHIGIHIQHRRSNMPTMPTTPTK